MCTEKLYNSIKLNSEKDKSMHQKKIAVFPASFDPVTYGHIDLVERILNLSIFDELIVAVAVNPDKTSNFTVEERVQMLKETVRDYPKVTVESITGLTARYVQERGASVIIRGLRAFSDFDFELHLALTNRILASDVDTLFLMSDEKYSHVSSTLVMQIAEMSDDFPEKELSEMVPPPVINRLRERHRKAKTV